eukprot:m.8561 g.8561  ORF g.8561 m.8561 type:complete len:93 (-) comp4075_c0_seq1:257-535(-)
MLAIRARFVNHMQRTHRCGTVTKDKDSMRLWRRRDGERLRVVTCRGNAVAFGTNGNNLVTGDVDGDKMKVWGAAGGSAFTAGKKNIGNGLYT